MKTKKCVMTSGVMDTLPHWLIRLLWFLWDSMEVPQKDSIQIFQLSHTENGQHILHTQEHPAYQKELDVPCSDAVDTTVYIIEDQMYGTMLLPHER